MRFTADGTEVIASILFVAVVGVVYFPGIGGFFVLDDLMNIVNNTSIHWQHLGWSELMAAASSGMAGPLGRPIAMVSFGVNYYFGGESSLPGLKLTNIALHAICGLLVYFLTKRLLPYWRQERPTVLAPIHWLAWVVALFWVLHPLQVSTVLYTVQRMTVLSGLFSLAGLLAFVHGREQLIAGRENGVWWIGSTLVAGGLAVLSKESGALLGHLELVVELIFFRFAVAPQVATWRKLFSITAVMVPVVLVTGYLLYIALVVSTSGYTFREFDLIQRLLTESRVLWFYLRLLLVPDHSYMSLHHDDFEISRGLLQPWTTLPALISWFGLGVASLYAWRKQYALPLVFGLWWFLANHLLESTVVPLELVFEHRNYLAALGIVMPMVFYFSTFIERVIRREGVCLATEGNVRNGWPLGLRPMGRNQSLLIILALLVGMLWITEVRARVEEWVDARLFFTNLLLHHPHSPRAWAEAGGVMADLRDFPGATSGYRKAAALDGREPGYLVSAVHFLMASKGEYGTDLELTEQSLSQYPLTPVTVLSLIGLGNAGLQFDENQREGVIKLLQTAVLNPQWLRSDLRGGCYYQLGNLKYYNGHQDEALQDWESAASLMRENGVEWRRLMLDLMDVYLTRGMQEKARQALAEIEIRATRDDIDSEQKQRLARIRLSVYGNPPDITFPIMR
ncbi:protein O-mannosyl-transferase [Gammaproteobacteria bacterium]